MLKYLAVGAVFVVVVVIFIAGLSAIGQVAVNSTSMQDDISRR